MMVMLRLSDLGKAYIKVVRVLFRWNRINEHLDVFANSSPPRRTPWCEGERVALSSQRF